MSKRRVFFLAGALVVGGGIATTASLSRAMPVAKLALQKLRFTLVDFIPVDEVIATQTISKEMSKAVPKIFVISGDRKVLGSCSATVISDSGILLTEGHCIDACKIKDYKVLPDGTVDVDHSHKRPTDCTIVINDSKVEIPLNVIDTSGCPMSPKARNGQKMICPYTEWALIQLDLSKVGPLPCLNTDDKPQTYGLPVATIGFPAPTLRFTEREAARDSEGGFRQYYSDGTILPWQNYCTNNFDDKKLSINGRLPFPSYAQTGALEAAVKSGVVFQSDVDEVEENSGGPLVSLATKKVIGLSTFFIWGGAAFECRGGTFFLSIRAIKQDMKAVNPALDLDQIFSCRAAAIP